MKKAPTLTASRVSLPPEGVGSPWGGPAAKPAPTLTASRVSRGLAGRGSRDASPLSPVQACSSRLGAAGSSPEGGQSALVRPGGGFIAAARTRIKICGLTREQDVDAAVAAGADAVGFVLYQKSPRHVSLERATELARRLPPFVTPVLLFVNEDAIKIAAACAGIPGATIQFHGDETPAQCLDATQQGARPFLRAARIPLGDSGRHFDLVKYALDYSKAQAILLDAHVDGYGGGGQTFNWSLLPPNVNAHLVLSGGLNAANVGDGILQVRPRCKTLAVDVSSGVEMSGPGNQGIKDPEKINRFVAAVRAADQQLVEMSHVPVSTT